MNSKKIIYIPKKKEAINHLKNEIRGKKDSDEPGKQLRALVYLLEVKSVFIILIFLKTWFLSSSFQRQVELGIVLIFLNDENYFRAF